MEINRSTKGSDRKDDYQGCRLAILRILFASAIQPKMILSGHVCKVEFCRATSHQPLKAFDCNVVIVTTSVGKPASSALALA